MCFSASAVCKGAKADLVFLIDGSWSIGDESFSKVIQFVFSMIGSFDVISHEGMQVRAAGKPPHFSQTPTGEKQKPALLRHLASGVLTVGFCLNRCPSCSTVTRLRQSSSWTLTMTKEWLLQLFSWFATGVETPKQVCSELPRQFVNNHGVC